MPEFRVRFWGVRGSIPTPGRKTARHGGNTACVEVDTGGDPIILDAGTGLREYGRTVRKRGPCRLHLLISHTHWDHIQGFPFFLPLYRPEFEITIYGPRPLAGSLEEAILHQFQYNYFPVRGEELRCRLEFIELDCGQFQIGNITVRTHYMNHPIRVLAYRLERNGRSVTYTGDNEPYYDPGAIPRDPDTVVRNLNKVAIEQDQQVVEFLRGVDLLIADAQYTDKEYRSRRGWGHCTVTHAVDYAVRARAHTLVLFHHEPVHNDAKLDAMLRTARRLVRNAGAKVRVLMAREGMTLTV